MVLPKRRDGGVEVAVGMKRVFKHVLACAAEGANPDWAIVLEAQEDFPALVLPQMVSSTRPVYRNRLDDIEGNRMAISVENLSPPVHNDDTHPATNVVKLLHDVISEKPTFLDDARHAYEYIQWLDTTLRRIDFLEFFTQSWDCLARLTYTQLRRMLARDLPEHIFAHAVAIFVYLYLQFPCTEEYMSDLLGLIAKKNGGLLTVVSRFRLLLIAEARGCAGIDEVADRYSTRKAIFHKTETPSAHEMRYCPWDQSCSSHRHGAR